MAAWNSQIRGNIIACRKMGWDPTEIVGEGNLLPSDDNRNAFTGLPDSPGATSIAPNSTNGIRFSSDGMDDGVPSKTSTSDPYPGMGSF